MGGKCKRAHAAWPAGQAAVPCSCPWRRGLFSCADPGVTSYTKLHSAIIRYLRELMPCVPHLQALLCLERLIAGQPKRQEGLMKAKAADPEGTDMPALHCILQVLHCRPFTNKGSMSY